MTVTIISAEPVKKLVEYGEPLQLRVKCQATGSYWLYFGLKPEAIDPSKYKWSMGELFGPYPSSQTKVVLSRYVPAEWTPPADTRWLFRALVSYNETGYTQAYVGKELRNAFSYGAPIKVSLNITVKGGGTTIPAPGIYYYEKGGQVTITAIPDSGWRFDHWAGHASGTSSSISITLDKSKTVWAYFVRTGDGVPPVEPPSEEPPEEEGIWDKIQAWVEANPLLAGGIAIAGILLLWPSGKGKK